MINSLKFGTDLINDISGFSFDKNSLKKSSCIIFLKFYIIFKEIRAICKRIQNIKMFY